MASGENLNDLKSQNKTSNADNNTSESKKSDLSNDKDLNFTNEGSGSNDNELINNILPSYHMFQSTISKPLNPSEEDFTREPPNYEFTTTPAQTPNVLTPPGAGATPEMTPISSAAASINAMQSPFTPGSVNSGTEFPFPIMNESETDQIEIWENTILANVHKLPNLSKHEKKSSIPQDLDIQLFVTRKVCQKGVAPDIINPSNIEFKQGDFIHGFVTIENHSSEPISFDMVYVVFEGTLIVLENNDGLIDTQKPKVVHKFLNMTDLFASWSFANIDRLTTDNGDPHDWCEGETDPYDNTILSLDLKRKFLPNVKYKRFFSFKVPDKLLDDICDIHNLNKHTELPSSLGFPKYTMKPSSLLSKKQDTVNDLSFLDTSINYSVECRVIGKANDYDVKMEKDQYVIANESLCPVRVVPLSNNFYIEDNEQIYRYYLAFVKSVTDQIELGNSMVNAKETLNELSLSPVSSTDSKSRQLYNHARNEIEKSFVSSKQFMDNIYQNIIPYKRRTLLSNKAVSLISLSTPKLEYNLNYVPPPKYRSSTFKPNYDEDFILRIPLKLTYHNSASKSYPEVKSIKSELIAGTFRSNNHPIPVEFNHDVVIKDEELQMIGLKTEQDCFAESVTKPFKKYLKQLTELIDKLGCDTFRVERRLYDDVKSLAQLTSKFSIFPIANVSTSVEDNKKVPINSIPWEQSSSEVVDKTFMLNIDLRSCTSKQHQIPKNSSFFDYITLVPDSQTCFSVRLYYVKIIVKLTNGDSLTVKTPLKIIK